MDIDVALVPSQVGFWPPRVCVVVDQLRASTTITTALDLGCGDAYVVRGLADARRVAARVGGLLSGERRGLTPPGFHVNNSPAQLRRRTDLAGRPFVLSTSNGTAVLTLVAEMPAVLVGCLMNASAVARAAVEIANARDLGVGVVCAGILGRFDLEDALAAGVIVERILAHLARSGADAADVRLGDGSIAARAIAAESPDIEAAFEATETGRLLHVIGQAEDIAECAAIDTSATVAVLRPGRPLRLERYAGATPEGMSLDPDAMPLGASYPGIRNPF